MVKVINVNGFWKELPPHSKEGIYLDGKLKEKLDNIIKIRKQGYDALFIIDGDRRTGKSTLAMTCGTYLDPNFSMKNIVSGMDNALKVIESLPNESFVLFDESSLVFSSKDHATKAQKQLLKIIDVIGQKRMAMCLCLPTFFDLSRPIAKTHSRFLIHVYTDKDLKRGRFAYYSTHKKDRLYENGKRRFNSYLNPRADWFGRFTDFQPPFNQEYLKLKKVSLHEALKGTNNEKEKENKIKDFIQESLKRNQEHNLNLTEEQLGLLFGVSKRSISRYKQDARDKDKRQAP
jgi:hypothetical protein